MPLHDAVGINYKKGRNYKPGTTARNKDKPRLILVSQTDDLGWYITSNQQGKMFVQNLNRIVRKPNVTPRQFSYCTQTVFQLT